MVKEHILKASSSVWPFISDRPFVSFSHLVYLPVFCFLGFGVCMCVSKSGCAFVSRSSQYDLITVLPKLWIVFGICLDFKANHQF